MWSLETLSPLFRKWEQVYRKEVCCHPSCSTPTCLDCQHHLTASNSHRTRTTARHTRQGLLFPRFVRGWRATWLPCMSGLRSMIWNSLLASPRQQFTPPSVRSQEVSMSLPIKIGQHTVPTTKNPKILGVTLDSLHTFNAHFNNSLNKIRKRNSVLKALADSSWGKDKELLTTIYKAISRPVVNYAAPIWTPALRVAHWSKLQAAQNSSLHVITGCTKMTHIDELHRETKLLPVKEHNTMLFRPVVLQTHQTNHPNRQWNHTDPPQRLMKPTLISCHQDSIEPQLTNTEGWYKSGIKSIHTTAVSNTINGYEPKKVFQMIPPVINLDERRLPRSTEHPWRSSEVATVLFWPRTWAD